MTWDLEDGKKQSQDDTETTPDKQEPLDTVGGPPARPEAMRHALEQAMPMQVAVGDIVKGLVAAVDNQWVSVDIGSKDEGVVPISEFAGSDEPPAVDDEIEVAVVRIDEDKGQVRLSKRRADYERVWNRLTEAAENEQVVEALVTERVKGGLRVDVGVPGFVPGSHVASRNLRNLERFVGQSLRLRVLEADRRSKKVILSHRLVVEQEREQRRQDTLGKLQEGLECEGKVRSLTNYGAFIDLGGVDGLLHVSEMAWTRVKHPSDVLSVGDTVRVVVLEIDRETDRISLSRRQILPDPWKEVSRKLRVGNVVKARISRVVRTGAFAQLLDHDIEGFIPIGEMSEKRVAEASDVVAAGQELELKVVEMRPSARRMTLSLVAAEQEKERREYRDYMASQESARVTLGDQFGDILQQVASADEDTTDQGGDAAQQPSDQPSEQSVEEPAQQPVDDAAEEAVEELVEDAAEEAAEELVEDAAEEAVEELVEEPVEASADDAAEEAVVETADDADEQGEQASDAATDEQAEAEAEPDDEDEPETAAADDEADTKK